MSEPARSKARSAAGPAGWKLPASLKLSTYLSSSSSRAKSQHAAKGTRSGPTGQEVDTYIAGTLTRKDLARAKADMPPQLAKDDLGRIDGQRAILVFEELNDPSLQDDPETFPNGRPEADCGTNVHQDVTAATTNAVSQDLLDKVLGATNGKQTSVPYIEAPPSNISPSILPSNEYGFVDPRAYGGTSFDLVGNGQHEPLNVVISGLSSPEILTRKGFQSYCRSLSFDRECFGMHLGTPQKGYTDPRGWRDQELLYRQVYSPLDHVFGTCMESLVGGNHIRAWQQQASGAWFLAVSKEENATKNHMIIPDGYNIGREELVAKAQGSKKDGDTSFLFTNYATEVTYVAGLMPAGVEGGVNHGISVDGLTAVLTVKIIDRGAVRNVSSAPQTQQTSLSSQPKTAASGLKKKTQAAWIKIRASVVPKHGTTPRITAQSSSVDSNVSVNKEPEHQESTTDLMPRLASSVATK